MSRLLVVLVFLAACGGKAVIDEEGECDCETAADCPASDRCGAYTCAACRCEVEPQPRATACLDGYCDGAGACIKRAEICARACEVIPVCLASTPAECVDFCFDDLFDCSAAEMAETDDCTDELAVPACNGDAWLACVLPIACLETETP